MLLVSTAAGLISIFTAELYEFYYEYGDVIVNNIYFISVNDLFMAFKYLFKESNY